MSLTYDAAVRLFRHGEFAAMVREAGTSRDPQLDARVRSLHAYALGIGGQLRQARELVISDVDSDSPLVRSYVDSVLALVSSRAGDLQQALQHAQGAVRSAQTSNDAERSAWAHLFLLRLLVECGSFDRAAATLADCRRAVARAAIGQATAHLHISVSVLEGQAGHVDEARRHCDVADALLDVAPNTWLKGASLLNRGCIASLKCDFKSARDLFQRAYEAATRSGHVFLALAAKGSIGHVQMLLGQFEAAEHTLVAVLNDPRVGVPWKLGACEGLARTFLAQRRLDDSERVLEMFREQIQRQQQSTAAYHMRWSTITRARLHLKRGRTKEALEVLHSAEEQLRSLTDVPLYAAIQMVIAEAIAVEDPAKAGTSLINASNLDIAGAPEFHPQFEYAAARSIAKFAPALAEQLRNRAFRLWSYQGVVASHLEMNNDADASSMVENLNSSSPDCVANSIVAMCDVADRPSLLGAEALSAIASLRCCDDARVIETPISRDPRTRPEIAMLPLGVENGHRLTLICEKPSDPVRAILLANVLRLVRSALELERYRSERRNRAAVWPAREFEHDAGGLFVSEDMQSLVDVAQRVATTTAPVLITGETGTGKEVLARVIHAHSDRAKAPFLPFNCSSTPKDMLDSQLFGHRRGAFTGAIDSFPGVIRAAAGGTLFLDEIGETTPEVQPKLLRFLESGEVHPIGEANPVRVDVRVIAATNADLDALMAQGRFREDLFYRLNIVRLHVPPLRERRVEIPALASHYLQKHAQEYRKGDLRLAEETMEYLVLYRWPGNVRQLANEMRRMAALAETGAVLMPEHLSPEIAASRRTVPASDRALDPTELVVRVDQPVAAAMQHLERAMIQYALKRCGGRMEETAAMLGVSRKGLYLKRLRYGLDGGELSADVA